MRKITFLLVLLAYTGMTFAQNASLFKNDAKEEKKMTQTATKSTNIPFWVETFDKEDWFATVTQGDKGGYLSNGTDLPNGWTAEDLSGNGYLWHWSDVGPRGRWTSGSATDLPGSLIPDNTYLTDYDWPAGTTLENGFMMLESDFYNTNELGEMVSDPLDMNSHLILGPIDCSGKAGVLVKFNTLYRFCCSSGLRFNLEISNDYDPANPTLAHWDLKQIDIITLTNNDTHPDERAVEINVSSTATDQANVYIRFSTSGLSHYYTIIDDVTFVEPPANDLVLVNAWAEYMYEITSGDHFWGGYTELPKDAVSNFEVFEAAIYNNGTNDATNAAITAKLFKDDALVETLTSPAKNISSNDKDTLTIATSFTPTDIASYQVSMTLASDATDAVPANNGWEYNFKTSANTYSRVRHGSEDSFGSASTGDWVGGGFDGDMLLSEYVIDEGTNVVFSGVNVYIYPTTDEAELEAIDKGQYQMKAVGFVSDEEEDDLVDINLSSELYTISSADLGRWVYLPYNDEGSSLKGAGDYYVGIETYTATNDELRFRIGSDDLGVEQPNYVNYIFQTSGSSPGFGWVTANFALDLMINMPDMVYLTVNYDMSEAISAATFDPDVDDVYVTGSFSDWAEPGTTGSVKANYDATHQIATARIMIESTSAGTTIDYKGFVNTGWDGGEWTGDPNRSIIVANADVAVNHTYGVFTSINNSDLQFAKLFPNPFNETLTIDNLVDVKEITVSNILGQKIMAITDIEETVTISSAELEKGVFIITIVDNYNNVRTERVVKH